MRAACCLVLLSLSGCTAVAVPPGTTLSTPQTQAAAAGVQTYGTEVPAGAKQIGMVKATACQRFQWDPIPTNDMALELLKGEAWKAGGNAVAGVSYVYSNISIGENCYGTIVAKGLALLQ